MLRSVVRFHSSPPIRFCRRFPDSPAWFLDVSGQIRGLRRGSGDSPGGSGPDDQAPKPWDTAVALTRATSHGAKQGGQQGARQHHQRGPNGLFRVRITISGKLHSTSFSTQTAAADGLQAVRADHGRFDPPS